MKNPISPIIIEKLPSFLKTDYRRFYTFISHYFRFLEEQGNPLDILSQFYENLEVNGETDIYIDKIIEELGFTTKKTITIPKKQLVHHLRDFYLSRGSENSFKFLFKILFNNDIVIDYPRKRLFVTSASTYSGRYFIFTTSEHYEQISSYFSSYNLTIQGVSSKEISYVENISPVFSYGKRYLKVQIDSDLKNFRPGEAVELIFEELNIKVIENIVRVVDLTINDPGYGYRVNDKVNITGTEIEGSARVSEIESSRNL